MKKYLKLARKSLVGDFFHTLLFALSKQTANILLYPDVKISAARTARIYGSGLIHMGRTWAGMRYFPGEVVLREGAELCVDGEVWINTGLHISVNQGAKLKIGSAGVNNHLSIDCFDSITIGKDVAISKRATLRDSDNQWIVGAAANTAPIVIGDHVWITINVTILKGVHIGSGSVVAAGAVVTRDVPENTLVGGVPAKIIRRDVAWEWGRKYAKTAAGEQEGTSAPTMLQ